MVKKGQSVSVWLYYDLQTLLFIDCIRKQSVMIKSFGRTDQRKALKAVLSTSLCHEKIILK